MRDRKAALEMSVGTIVVVVLAMTMLVLGLILVGNIFSGATDSVDALNDKVKAEITKLFVDESSNVVIMQKDIKIKTGETDFGVGIGGKLEEGGNVDSVDRLQYELTLVTDDDYCTGSDYLGPTETKDLFDQEVGADKWNEFDKFQDEYAFARITLTIPKGTKYCKQKVKVRVKDTDPNPDEILGGDFFVIHIVKGGLGGLFS